MWAGKKKHERIGKHLRVYLTLTARKPLSKLNQLDFKVKAQFSLILMPPLTVFAEKPLYRKKITVRNMLNMTNKSW